MFKLPDCTSTHPTVRLVLELGTRAADTMTASSAAVFGALAKTQLPFVFQATELAPPQVRTVPPQAAQASGAEKTESAATQVSRDTVPFFLTTPV